jgi:hypothetical protein
VYVVGRGEKTKENGDEVTKPRKATSGSTALDERDTDGLTSHYWFCYEHNVWVHCNQYF